MTGLTIKRISNKIEIDNFSIDGDNITGTIDGGKIYGNIPGNATSITGTISGGKVNSTVNNAKHASTAGSATKASYLKSYSNSDIRGYTLSNIGHITMGGGGDQEIRSVKYLVFKRVIPSDSFQIGNSAQDYIYWSDPRFKYQETNLSNQTSIETIRKLNAYQYKFKKEKESDKFDYGFMADEVENVIPDAVLTRPTVLDIENIECNYTLTDNRLLLTDVYDDEFDTNCIFKMLYTKCDFSNVSISEVNETTNTCILDTSHNLNYIGFKQTDPLREYIYAHKENIKVRIDNNEYTTKLVYDKNIELNQLKIDITNIPITQDMSNVEIYGPSENYEIDAPVVEKTTNEESGLTNYTLELLEEQLEEIKDKSYDTMIWYAVNVKDGRSLNYNHIFMHYHGAIQYLDKENTELKNEVGTLRTELEQIKEHLGL